MYFAFIFDSVGGTEWFVLLGVILIVVGPKNLPSAARKLGAVMTKLRRAADEFKRQLLSMDEEFKKGVESAVNDYVETPQDDASSAPSGDSTAASEPASSAQTEDGTDRAATDYYGGEYNSDSPYPGHEYYDETQYQNEPYTGDASADASDGGTAASEPEQTKADPYAVKITVSTTAGDAGKHA